MFAGLLNQIAAPAQQLPQLTFDGSVDSAMVGSVRVFAELRANPDAQHSFTLEVWALNTGRDSVAITYQCNSVVLEFTPNANATSDKLAEIEWRPELAVKEQRRNRPPYCPVIVLSPILGPGERRNLDDISARGPRNDPQLRTLTRGSYSLVTVLHIDLGVSGGWYSNQTRHLRPAALRLRVGQATLY